MRSVFIHSPQFARFKAYNGYPWLFKRSDVTYRLCKQLQLFEHDWMTIKSPEPLGSSDILSFHTKEYIALLKKANRGRSEEKWLKYGLGTTECPVYKGVYDYHVLAGGATLLGAELIDRNQTDVVFNPTGGFHHAGKDFASGFCYINDIVIALKKLIRRGKRILFVDIDAHHGDQVQEAFYRSGKVLCMSFHESGKTLFPFRSGFVDEIGKGHGKGYTINVPLPAHTSDREFLWAFGEIFSPVVEVFKPDIVVAALGVDGLASDPFSNLQLTNLSLSQALKHIVQVSPKLLAVGCGGYVLTNIARTWTLAWAVMNGLAPMEEDTALYGGMFWGDGLASLRDHPRFVSDDVRGKVEAEVRSTVLAIKKTIFPILGISN